MTPALAHAFALISETTCALAVPSLARAWEMRRNWSDVPQMSPPPPWTVQWCRPLRLGPGRGGAADVGAREGGGADPGGSVDVVPMTVPSA